MEVENGSASDGDKDPADRQGTSGHKAARLSRDGGI